ncbi:MAG: hypothetical protein L6R37_002288 [Teloschistes peruensis]|nr:MAG: hypothetical protein L6R37_002288 [Teloschistes peruensis]
MRFAGSLAAASAFSVFAAAIPVDLQPRTQDFMIHQSVPKPFKSGPAKMLSTYAKYNATAPQDVINAAQANDGSVTTTPEQYDTEYLTPVTIGGQTLNLDFDTGSSDLWVFSSELSSSLSNAHSIYNPALSPTSMKLPGYTWKISYGDGSGASGDVYTDVVKVGSTTVSGQAVELAQQISTQFANDIDNDGLLGLAFDSINTVQPVKQKTFFSNAKASLSAPLFTANLKKGQPGTYTFGYIDAAQHSGGITYVPVNTANGFWEFTSNGYAVGSGAFVSSSIDSIADTGTTLLYLPSSVVTAYYSKVSGARYDSNQGGYTFPCANTLPSLTLGIGSYKAVVPGSYIKFAPVTSTTCFGGVQSNTGIGFSIFGDIFLKSQFVVFQASPLQLGFGPKTL